MTRRTCLARFVAPALLAGAIAAQVGDDVVMTDFVRTHCIECHGGDAVKGDLDLSLDAGDDVARAFRWSRLRERVLAGEMPPPAAEQPDAAARRAFVVSLEAALRRAVPKLPSDPGRVTVRRLSRAQWQRTVRDLFGVAVSTAAFPADDLGYGFDTIGAALTFSTLHLEHYLAAARAVAEQVFDGEDPNQPTVRRFEAEAMELVAGPGAGLQGEVANLYTRATIEQAVRLPRDGVYELRVFAGADQAGDEAAKMRLQLDGRDLETFEVGDRAPRRFDLRATLLGGLHRIALAFVNDHFDPKHPDPKRRDRNLHIDWLEVVGPTDARMVPAEQRWLQTALAVRGDERARLRSVVRALLPRAFRRPVTEAEVARSHRLGDVVLRGGGTPTEALRTVLQASLASPHFLFRLEAGGVEGTPGAVVPLGGAALAQRLSYFLWGSAPDDVLTEQAQKGALATDAGLVAAAGRMLADPRAESLATDFAAQWLELRNLVDRTPDPDRFPGFDDDLRASLRRESELLFQAILRDGRDVRDLLDCGFTHVDARLAAFYGLARAEGGSDFVRVELPAEQRERGGLLGHAGIHALTSNPTRTSPVKRGKWVLENLLGQPPPPPPPGNDSFADEAAIDSTRTLREQLAEHRERAACAVCHTRMDALGFAFERYDAIGRHREVDAGGAIDCRGELPDGRVIEGLAGLKAALRADPAFVRTVARKLFVYAIGRDVRPVDRLRLDLAVDELLLQGKVTLRDLVLVVVRDAAFSRRVVEAR